MLAPTCANLQARSTRHRDNVVFDSIHQHLCLLTCTIQCLINHPAIELSRTALVNRFTHCHLYQHSCRFNVGKACSRAHAPMCVNVYGCRRSRHALNLTFLINFLFFFIRLLPLSSSPHALSTTTHTLTRTHEVSPCHLCPLGIVDGPHRSYGSTKTN